MNERFTVIEGDCLKTLRQMGDASVDAVVTDPPYEISFMSRAWDASGVAYSVRLWREVLRVLKPGGHLLAFGAPRTYHRLACGIEDAGFEIRDSIHWVHSQGFPKSLDVSKAIDKGAGARREVVGVKRSGLNMNATANDDRWNRIGTGEPGKHIPITAPATDAARKWDGFGSALKPSHEPIVLARKPLEGTIAANVQTHGTGALNIDGTRIAHDSGVKLTAMQRCKTLQAGHTVTLNIPGHSQPTYAPAGRWPSNLILSHSPDCERVGTRRVKGKDQDRFAKTNGGTFVVAFTKYAPRTSGGDETVDAWRCAPGCPVAELDAQSGVTTSPGRTGRGAGGQHGKLSPIGAQGTVACPSAAGGASRFFYVCKPSRRERNDGVMRNDHNTVKPVQLMRYLVRLVTPPGGLVLDPFCGSGTTGIAALKEGMRFLGLEKEPAHVKIATARLAKARFGVSSLSQRAMFG